MPQHYRQTLRAFAAERPRRAYFAWAISGFIAAAWMIWFLFAPVTVHAISDRARLEVAEAPSGVDAPVAGQIVATVIGMGKSVKQGDVLVELDSSRERLLMKEEELRLDAAASKIEALKTEIAARQRAVTNETEALRQALGAARARVAEASAAVDFAVNTESRVTKLAEKGIAPRVEAEKARSDRRRLEASAAALKSEAMRIEGEIAARADTGKADIDRLNYEAAALAGDYSASQAAVSRLSLELERHLLRAPVSGRLADVVKLHAGSVVSEGQRLAVIVPEGEVQIIAEFEPSPALGRVEAGQHAELRLDGFPWAQFGMLGATVRRVDSEIHDGLIRVELGLDPGTDGSALIQHGLPGSVAVSIEQVTPAILLLRAAGVMLSGAGRAEAAVR